MLRQHLWEILFEIHDVTSRPPTSHQKRLEIWGISTLIIYWIEISVIIQILFLLFTYSLWVTSFHIITSFGILNTMLSIRTWPTQYLIIGLRPLITRKTAVFTANSCEYCIPFLFPANLFPNIFSFLRYLTGDQFSSISSVEAYARCLNQGKIKFNNVN